MSKKKSNPNSLPSKEWSSAKTDELVEAIMDVEGQACVHDEGMDLWNQLHERFQDWTPDEIKKHFQRNVYKNLTDLVGPHMAKTFQAPRNKIKSEKTSDKKPKVPKLKYSHVEDYRIIKLIQDHPGKIFNSGNEFWKAIEPQFNGKRTWQSLRSHYLKKLKDNVQNYIFNKHDLEAFKKKFIHQAGITGKRNEVADDIASNSESEERITDSESEEKEKLESNEEIELSSDDEEVSQNLSSSSQMTSGKRQAYDNDIGQELNKSVIKTSSKSDTKNMGQKHVILKPSVVEDDNESEEEESPTSKVSPLKKRRKLDSQEPTHGTLEDSDVDTRSQMIQNSSNSSTPGSSGQKKKNETESVTSTVLYLINAMKSSNEDIKQAATTALLSLTQATKHIALLEKKNK